jgi:hypothetical protein
VYTSSIHATSHYTNLNNPHQCDQIHATSLPTVVGIQQAEKTMIFENTLKNMVFSALKKCDSLIYVA